MKHSFFGILVFAILFPAPISAQNFTFNDLAKIEAHFAEQHDTTLKRLNGNGWGILENLPARQSSFFELAGEIDQLLKNPRSFEYEEFLVNYNSYRDFSRAIFNDPETFGQYEQTFVYPIQSLASEALEEKIETFFRKFDVKFGENSRKLNIFEAWLATKRPFSPPATGADIRDPRPWEPIAQIQLIGYQYTADTGELLPAYPTVQAGLTCYLFADNSFARYLNRVGLAGAYQYNPSLTDHFFGFVVHVRGFEIGHLYNISGNGDPVIVASFNISLFKNWKDTDWFKNLISNN